MSMEESDRKDWPGCTPHDGEDDNNNNNGQTVKEVDVDEIIMDLDQNKEAVATSKTASAKAKDSEELKTLRLSKGGLSAGARASRARHERNKKLAASGIPPQQKTQTKAGLDHKGQEDLQAKRRALGTPAAQRATVPGVVHATTPPTGKDSKGGLGCDKHARSSQYSGAVENATGNTQQEPLTFSSWSVIEAELASSGKCYNNDDAAPEQAPPPPPPPPLGAHACFSVLEVPEEEEEDDPVDDAQWLSSPAEYEDDSSEASSGPVDVELGESPQATTSDPPPAADNLEGLVEARPVTNDPALENLASAEPLDPVAERERLTLKNEKEQKEKHCRRFGYAIIAIASTVIVLAVVFGRKKESNPEISYAPRPNPDDSIDDDLWMYTANGTLPPNFTWMPNETFTTSTPPPTYFGNLQELMAGLPNYTIASLTDVSSPQWQAMSWLEHHQNITNLPEWRKVQLFALATFYYSFEGPNWRQEIRDDWMDDTKSECFWFNSEYGSLDGDTYVEEEHWFSACDESDRFNSLMLDQLDLSEYNPVMPPEINLLTSMQIIQLSDCGINVSLSKMLPIQLLEMTNLTSITLGSGNYLSGVIPSELGLMTQLSWLSLTDNRLSGRIPSELGSMVMLSDLHLRGNRLTGFIPTYLGSLPTMQRLRLDSNFLTGPIPSELGMIPNGDPSNMLEGMMTLNLHNNSLDSQIPSEIGLLHKLVLLDLSSNDLSGPIPSELGLLKYFAFGFPSGLQTFDLHANALSGEIPPELGGLHNVKKLSLSSNYLSGTIPSKLFMASKLTMLDLLWNSLTGVIPPEIERLTELNELFLTWNELSGTLPYQMGYMTELTNLVLWSNALSGTIPSTLGLLTKLTAMDLDANGFSGALPTEIGEMQALQELRISMNWLSSSIPSQTGMLSNLQGIWLYDNLLTGPIPSQLGMLTNMTAVDLAINTFSDRIPSELGLMPALRYMFLGNNSLLGTIPTELSQLLALEELELVYLPLLQGTIPTGIGVLVTDYNLTYLNITGSNGLSGTIPEPLCQLNSYNASFVCPLENYCPFDFDCTDGRLCGCGCNCTATPGNAAGDDNDPSHTPLSDLISLPPAAWNPIGNP